jgi:hypothetical protein
MAASSTAAPARSLIYLTVKGGFSAGFIFALSAWAGVAATAIYLVNAYFG